jgi:hypothetical protein
MRANERSKREKNRVVVSESEVSWGGATDVRFDWIKRSRMGGVVEGSSESRAVEGGRRVES